MPHFLPINYIALVRLAIDSFFLSKSHYLRLFIMPNTNCKSRMHDRKHKLLHYRMLSNKQNNTLIVAKKKENRTRSHRLKCEMTKNGKGKTTNTKFRTAKEKNKIPNTYAEEMWSQSSNWIFCNVRCQCVDCCAKGKHTNLTVSICYPSRYTPSKQLQFYFGGNFIQFCLNYFGGTNLKM